MGLHSLNSQCGISWGTCGVKRADTSRLRNEARVLPTLSCFFAASPTVVSGIHVVCKLVGREAHGSMSTCRTGRGTRRVALASLCQVRRRGVHWQSHGNRGCLRDVNGDKVSGNVNVSCWSSDIMCGPMYVSRGSLDMTDATGPFPSPLPRLFRPFYSFGPFRLASFLFGHFLLSVPPSVFFSIVMKKSFIVDAHTDGSRRD